MKSTLVSTLLFSLILLLVNINGQAQFRKNDKSKNSTTNLVPANAPGVTGNARELARVTNDPIVEYYPQASPDGKKLLFFTRDDNKKDNERFGIMYINLGQPGRTPLIGSHTNDASWLADSKGIIYCYLRPAKPIICKGSIEGSYGIAYVTPSAMGDADANPHVSPDGKKILFSSKIGGIYQMSLMDINGINFTVLSEGYYASWHVSGNSFLYTKMVGKFEQIFSYDMKTGQSTQLTSGEFANFNAAYSPDGSYIVFCSTRDGQSSHVFIMNSNGSALTQLTQGNTSEWYPTISSDGLIYFCSNAGAPADKPNIYQYSDIWSVKYLTTK